MARLHASIDIMASPRVVFSLVEDLVQMIRLNPSVKVLGIAKETNGPVNVGTTFICRLVVAGKITEHRCQCTGFIPGKVMETVSDTNPKFHVRTVVEPIPGGTRLTHEEFFTLPGLMFPIPQANGWLGKLLRFMFGDKRELKQDPESIAADEAELESMLQPRLISWLNRIKNYLEQQPSVLAA